MKTPIFLVALLAPVALYAAPGIVTVVGDETSGIFSKQYAAPPAPVVYTGISPGVEDNFVQVVDTGISPDVRASYVQVVDASGNVVDPNEIALPTPTLYHQSGSRRPYQNQIGGGYYPGGRPQRPGIGGVISNVVGGAVSGLVHGQHGHHGGSYPSRYPSGYPGSGYPGSGYPGSGYPGSGYPGSGYPGSGYPGSGYPGSGYPGSGYPGSHGSHGNQGYYPGSGGYPGSRPGRYPSRG